MHSTMHYVSSVFFSCKMIWKDSKHPMGILASEGTYAKKYFERHEDERKCLGLEILKKGCEDLLL